MKLDEVWNRVVFPLGILCLGFFITLGAVVILPLFTMYAAVYTVIYGKAPDLR